MGLGAQRFRGEGATGLGGGWLRFYSWFIQEVHHVTLGLSHSPSTAASPSVK